MGCSSCNNTVKCKAREKKIKDNVSKLNTLITINNDNELHQEYRRLLKEIGDYVEENGYCMDYALLKEITNYVNNEYYKYN